MSNLNHLKEFTDTLEHLARRYEPTQVFDDFLTMAICAYHRTNIQSKLSEKDEENEALYHQTIAKYDKETINAFPKLLGILQVQVYEEPYSDLLGEYFTQHITKGQNGQYFTPEPICDLMTKLNSPEKQTKQRVLDPACGSGRFLLKFAQSNPDNAFFGADISATCAKMTTLIFFLNGLRGEVSWMNTLSMDWYGGWHINTQDMGIVPINKDNSILARTPIKQDEVKKTSEQLTLF